MIKIGINTIKFRMRNSHMSELLPKASIQRNEDNFMPQIGKRLCLIQLKASPLRIFL